MRAKGTTDKEKDSDNVLKKDQKPINSLKLQSPFVSHPLAISANLQLLSIFCAGKPKSEHPKTFPTVQK